MAEAVCIGNVQISILEPAILLLRRMPRLRPAAPVDASVQAFDDLPVFLEHRHAAISCSVACQCAFETPMLVLLAPAPRTLLCVSTAAPYVAAVACTVLEDQKLSSRRRKIIVFYYLPLSVMIPWLPRNLLLAMRRHAWQGQVRQLLQDATVWSKAAAANRQTAEGVRELLNVLLGADGSLVSASDTWMEHLLAMCLHVYPGMRPQADLELLLHKSLASKDGAGVELLIVLEDFLQASKRHPPSIADPGCFLGHNSAIHPGILSLVDLLHSRILLLMEVLMELEVGTCRAFVARCFKLEVCIGAKS